MGILRCGCEYVVLSRCASATGRALPPQAVTVHFAVYGLDKSRRTQSSFVAPIPVFCMYLVDRS